MTNRLRNQLLPLAVAVAATAGCDGAEALLPGGGTRPANPPTYHEHVKPIVDARCVSCHVGGGIAPFALGTYTELKASRLAVRKAVVDRRMPPWLGTRDCNDYAFDESLTNAQIATIRDWVDAGAPEGDASRAGAALPKPPRLASTDLTLNMPTPYTPKKSPDDYRCFLLDWPETKTKFVSGFVVKPGNKAIVHHVIAFLAAPDQVDRYAKMDRDDPGPGYECFGGPNAGGGVQIGAGTVGWLGAWAPGGSDTGDFPEGIGLKVAPRSKVILQVHYNSTGAKPIADRSSVAFKLTDSAREARIVPFANPLWLLAKTMRIPAGKKEVKHAHTMDFTSFIGGEGYTIYSSALHMHQLGVSAKLSVERAGTGGKTCLLDIPRWDFGWQRTYRLAQPIRYKRGDKISLECRWDNSAANQPRIDGVTKKPADVNWGEGTGDEMCLGVLFVAADAP